MELDHLNLKETNPPLIQELFELYNDMVKKLLMSLCTIDTIGITCNSI